MHLIDEIIDLLSSNNPNLENALFKAKVLAHRLGESEFKQWIDFEVTGYPDITQLPSYRIIAVTVKGNASNSVYQYQDQPLPLNHLEKKLREKLSTTHLTQGIAVIEKYAAEDSDLSVTIPPELYSSLSEGLGNGYMVERAWGKHSVGAMTQVVSEVRSRLLDFLLDLID